MVICVSDIEVARVIYGHPTRIVQLGFCGRSPVPGKTIGAITGDSCDDAGSVNHSYAKGFGDV